MAASINEVAVAKQGKVKLPAAKKLCA